ncbi:MAG: DUF1566 domain-containing protein [Saprospiraceae bacterium]|nr:DUF1566 domain-containing protein [Saprospiraceae bacterium]
MKLNNLKILLLLFLGVGRLTNANAQILKSMKRLPDTGQTQSFTNTSGEDSDYQINAPGFIVNNNGTVTDTVTGLMWQQSDGGEMTIESAETYCQNLALGGFSDWRLPTAQEAFSILNHSRQNPPLAQDVFANTGAEYWWTSERQAGNVSKIWVTNAGGGIGNHPKTETISAGGTKKFHARAVRDVQPVPAIIQQFTLADSVVVDHLTGLEWQRFVLQDSMNWESALVYAENLFFGGKSDWRLPNIKELESLNDETKSQPSVDAAFFQGIGQHKYWSGTSLPNQTTRAWFLDTRFGVISYDLKTVRNSILCVRGPVSATSATPEINAEAVSVRIFPNPAQDYLVLQMTGSQSPVFWKNISMTDTQGRVVFQSAIYQERLLLPDLPKGIYYIAFQLENKVFCRSVVVE